MIVKNIQRLCEKNNISFAKLEKAVGLGNGVIAKWKDGNPRVDRLKLVADFFGVTVDDLLREETE